MPSLRIRWARWVSTVLIDKPSISAMLRLVLPSAINWSTCRSRGVSWLYGSLFVPAARRLRTLRGTPAPRYRSPRATVRTASANWFPAASFTMYPAAPFSSARTINSSSAYIVRISTGVFLALRDSTRQMSVPLRPGMARSSTTTSGLVLRTSSTTFSPSPHCPTTCRSGSRSINAAIPSRTNV